MSSLITTCQSHVQILWSIIFLVPLVLKVLQLKSVVAHCVACDSSLKKTLLILPKFYFICLKQSYVECPLPNTVKPFHPVVLFTVKVKVSPNDQSENPVSFCLKTAVTMYSNRNFKTYKYKQKHFFLPLFSVIRCFHLGNTWKKPDLTGLLQNHNVFF